MDLATTSKEISKYCKLDKKAQCLKHLQRGLQPRKSKKIKCTSLYSRLRFNSRKVKQCILALVWDCTGSVPLIKQFCVQPGEPGVRNSLLDKEMPTEECQP